ncbi:hypothetical protein ACLB2K_019217 [Fragaria x ananassa]
MKANNISLILLVCILVCINLGGCLGGSLRKNFYKQTCPRAEQIVKDATWNHVSANPNLPAKLLRMHFHDCFVRGCDASVLLSSTANNTAERDSFPNLSLKGFDVIDDIKEQLEKACPGVVSCADILALATRDSVSFQFKKSQWDVLTGRRDGNVSIANEVSGNLPSPFFNFAQLKQTFANKGLTVQDLVVLSGAHSIGVGHCNLFSKRLYNFTGKGDQDPSMDSTYAALLKTQCQGPGDRTKTVELDPGSFQNFDNSFYTILKQKKGLFLSDAALLTNKVSSNAVQKLLKGNDFFTEFGQSMKRMGAIEVLTGTSGQTRKQCGFVNSN